VELGHNAVDHAVEVDSRNPFIVWFKHHMCVAVVVEVQEQSDAPVVVEVVTVVAEYLMYIRKNKFTLMFFQFTLSTLLEYR